MVMAMASEADGAAAMTVVSITLTAIAAITAATAPMQSSKTESYYV